jgi:hypothetical protein
VIPEPISSDRWQGMENRPFPALSVISDRSELPGIGMRPPNQNRSGSRNRFLAGHKPPQTGSSSRLDSGRGRGGEGAMAKHTRYLELA